MDSIIYDFLPCDYTVVDVETTPSPDGHIRLIEVAAIRVRGNLVVDRCYSTINPKCPIKQDSYNVSKLRDEDVARSPSSEEFLPKLINFIGDDIIIGHNISSDINHICNEAGSSISNQRIDTLKLAQSLASISSGYKLEELCSYFNIPSLQKHRALYDCYSTYLVYSHLVPLYAEAQLKIFPIQEPDSNDYSQLAISTRLLLSIYQNAQHIFKDKNFVFTQIFTSIDRSHAETIIQCSGGVVQDSIKKDTNYLVIGNAPDERTMKKSNNPGISTKLLRAKEFNEKYKSKGVLIQILTEKEFIELLEVSLYE